jgi:hypothetical protein
MEDDELSTEHTRRNSLLVPAAEAQPVRKNISG